MCSVALASIDVNTICCIISHNLWFHGQAPTSGLNHFPKSASYCWSNYESFSLMFPCFATTDIAGLFILACFIYLFIYRFWTKPREDPLNFCDLWSKVRGSISITCSDSEIPKIPRIGDGGDGFENTYLPVKYIYKNIAWNCHQLT